MEEAEEVGDGGGGRGDGDGEGEGEIGGGVEKLLRHILNYVTLEATKTVHRDIVRLYKGLSCEANTHIGHGLFFPDLPLCLHFCYNLFLIRYNFAACRLLLQFFVAARQGQTCPFHWSESP